MAPGGDNQAYGGVSLGAGTFLSDNDVAPFVGGGVGVLTIESGSKHSRLATSGFAPYIEGGIGLFRTLRTGMRAGVRVDVPAFSSTSSTSSDKKYMVPVALKVALSF